MEAKRALIIAKLEQRHRKTVDANGKSDSNGQHGNLGEGDFSTNFQRRFYGEQSSIIAEMEQIHNEFKNSESLADNKKIDELSTRVSKLRSLLNESTSVLPSYEIRKANNILQELQDELKRARTEIQPQKRFIFTNLKPAAKPKPSATISSTNRISHDADVIDGLAGTASTLTSSAAAVVIQNRNNDASIVLSNEDCQGKDILLLNCQSCTIHLLGISTAVHAKQLVDCTVLSYPVSTSIFVEHCRLSVFVIACQQLRMHSSVDCDLYLHVTTAAIIEDCQKLRFAPFLDVLEDEDAEHWLEKSGLDRSKNTWNRVQDFNWLVSDQPSPNWQILQLDQRRRFRISIG